MTYTLELCFWVGVAAITSYFGQVWQSRAYQLEKAARVAATQYLQIVLAFLWDILIFKTVLHWWEIGGCLIIIGVMFSISLAKAMGRIN